MDINMKNVVLGKKEDKNDNWIYIATEMDGKFVKEGTKLLYDDGSYSNDDIKVIEEQLKRMNEYNIWDLADDYAGTLDLGLEKSV